MEWCARERLRCAGGGHAECHRSSGNHVHRKPHTNPDPATISHSNGHASADASSNPDSHSSSYAGPDACPITNANPPSDSASNADPASHADPDAEIVL